MSVESVGWRGIARLTVGFDAGRRHCDRLRNDVCRSCTGEDEVKSQCMLPTVDLDGAVTRTLRDFRWYWGRHISDTVLEWIIIVLLSKRRP